MADEIQKPNTATTDPKQDLTQQIKDLEEKYSKEVSSKDDLAGKLAQLEKQRAEIEENIEKDENSIRAKLGELKELKDWIEKGLKKINEEKSVLKEVEENENQIRQLEESKKKIDAGIKSLDAKLANLNHSMDSTSSPQAGLK